MSYLILGFMTGMSLILALGPQNIFVIEQGLKKEFIFLICLICSVSDFLLIFLGIYIFHYFQIFFTPLIEFILNFLLLIFLIYFIWGKIRSEIHKVNLKVKKKKYSIYAIILKTFGFTYLNPHVYSDTVFFLGNFSKDLILKEKLFFWLGASTSSFVAFFTFGYMSKYLSNYLKTKKVWKIINLSIIVFMFFLAVYVLVNIIKFLLINFYIFS
jgi:L-lysine exporter family protein LysE/ArgO